VTPSVTPILLGEDYQHLYFWIQAARLFMEDDPAEIVYVEHPCSRDSQVTWRHWPTSQGGPGQCLLHCASSLT
jgi:hypothetical protein